MAKRFQPLDGDDGHRQIDPLLFRELGACLLKHFIRCVPLSDQRDRLGPGQCDPLPLRVDRRPAPSNKPVEPLLALAQGARISGVHIDTIGAPIDLGGPRLDELQQGALQTAFLYVLLEPIHRLQCAMCCLAEFQTSLHRALCVVH